MSTVSSAPPSRISLGHSAKPIRVPVSTLALRTHVYPVVMSRADWPDHPVHLSQEILHALSHAKECHSGGWPFEWLVSTPVNAAGIGDEGHYVVLLSPILRHHQNLQPGPFRQSDQKIDLDHRQRDTKPIELEQGSVTGHGRSLPFQRDPGGTATSPR
jgi:hypothetical protein